MRTKTIVALAVMLMVSACRGAIPGTCRDGHVWVDARASLSLACVPTQRYNDSVNTSIRLTLDSLRTALRSDSTK